MHSVKQFRILFILCFQLHVQLRNVTNNYRDERGQQQVGYCQENCLNDPGDRQVLLVQYCMR